jgi:hypothetical protein
MSFNDLLLRPKFWISFIILVILFLFVYGSLIHTDKSSMSKTKNDLEIAHKTIDENVVEIAKKNEEIYNLNSELNKKNEEISNTNPELLKKNEEISNLNSELNKKNKEIYDLNSVLNKKNEEISDLNSVVANKNEEISNLNSELNKKADRTKGLDPKVVPFNEPHHSFGRGNSKILIYSTCGNVGTIKIWIDGIYKGDLTEYFSNNYPNCSDSRKGSVVVSIVHSGKHQILAKTSGKRVWNFYIMIRENDCILQNLSCNN